MALPIDFSIQRPKSSHPFLPLNFSRFLSSFVDQKQTRFPVGIPNPIMWRHFPQTQHCDHKYPFNQGFFDHFKSISPRSKPNPLFINPLNRLLPPANPLFSGQSTKFPWLPSSESSDCTQSVTQGAHVIQLNSGVNKRMDEVTENDLWSSTVDNEEFSPQWSEIRHMSHNFEQKKCELVFSTDDKQITYSSEIHRPFFVKTFGWCSVFPALTERIFGISCLTLEVGHVCLTLRRKRKRPSHNDDSSNKKKCKQSPKSDISTTSI